MYWILGGGSESSINAMPVADVHCRTCTQYIGHGRRIDGGESLSPNQQAGSSQCSSARCLAGRPASGLRAATVNHSPIVKRLLGPPPTQSPLLSFPPIQFLPPKSSHTNRTLATQHASSGKYLAFAAHHHRQQVPLLLPPSRSAASLASTSSFSLDFSNFFNCFRAFLHRLALELFGAASYSVFLLDHHLARLLGPSAASAKLTRSRAVLSRSSTIILTRFSNAF